MMENVEEEFEKLKQQRQIDVNLLESLDEAHMLILLVIQTC